MKSKHVLGACLTKPDVVLCCIIIMRIMLRFILVHSGF